MISLLPDKPSAYRRQVWRRLLAMVLVPVFLAFAAQIGEPKAAFAGGAAAAANDGGASPDRFLAQLLTTEPGPRAAVEKPVSDDPDLDGFNTAIRENPIAQIDGWLAIGALQARPTADALSGGPSPRAPPRPSTRA